MPTWTQPYDLTEFIAPKRGSYTELRHKGVYRVFLVDPKGAPVQLRRLLAKDPSGTLYIGGTPRGETSTVFGRLKDFARSVEHAHTGDAVGHRGGWNLYVFALLDKLGVPHGAGSGDHGLKAQCVVDPGWRPADSAKLEAKLLLRYRGVFGDNPPANLSTGHVGIETADVRAGVDAASVFGRKAWTAL